MKQQVLNKTQHHAVIVTKVMATKTLSYNHRHICPAKENAESVRTHSIYKLNEHRNGSLTDDMLEQADEQLIKKIG